MLAEAVTHFLLEQWIPAYAGMTIKGLVETMTNPDIYFSAWFIYDKMIFTLFAALGLATPSPYRSIAVRAWCRHAQ